MARALLHFLNKHDRRDLRALLRIDLIIPALPLQRQAQLSLALIYIPRSLRQGGLQLLLLLLLARLLLDNRRALLTPTTSCCSLLLLFLV